MSKKAKDGEGRWRSKPITFRMSPEENAELDMRVRLSGLTKQEYLVSRALQREVHVYANPKVRKEMSAQLEKVFIELNRVSAGETIDELTLKTIQMLALMLCSLCDRGEETTA